MAYRGPKYSCRDFDAAIEHIEIARDINGELRGTADALLASAFNWMATHPWLLISACIVAGLRVHGVEL